MRRRRADHKRGGRIDGAGRRGHRRAVARPDVVAGEASKTVPFLDRDAQLIERSYCKGRAAARL
jgi:hypothetical protein